jgi:LuxR family maltose regulon positive regulatory protein
MNTNTRSFAKVTRPTPSNVLERNSLFELIDQRLEQLAIWVMGPPGCGKTILVSSYIDQRRLPCLWYQIDEGDADPATLFYYLGLALKKAAPRTRKPLPILSPEYAFGLPTFTIRFFEDLFSRLKTPSIVVFDNYQDAALDSEIHSLMRAGLSQIPSGVNVILISRESPPPALTRMTANQQMSIIGNRDLRLTRDESDAIIALRTDRDFSKETKRLFFEQSNGWAAGLSLLLEASQYEQIETGKTVAISHEEIFGYFAEEILNRTEQRTRQFLIKTAIFPKMTIKMAEALTEYEDASRILIRLTRRNYFISRHVHKITYYQYHPLFRAFLKSVAEEQLENETLSELRFRAAGILEQAGEIEAAAEVYLELGNWNAMLQLIMTNAPAFVEVSRFQVINNWLSRIPAEVINEIPWLLYWQGVGILPLDPMDSLANFEKAFALFKEKQDSTGELLAWSGIIDATEYAGQDFRPLDFWITVFFDELNDKFNACPVDEIKHYVASDVFKALMMRQPDHHQLEKWAQCAQTASTAMTAISRKAHILMVLSVYYTFFKHEKRKAESIIMDLRLLNRSQNATTLVGMFLKFTETMYFQFNANHSECVKTSQEAMALSIESGIRVFDGTILAYMVSSFLNVKDLNSAGKYLKELGSSLSMNRTLIRAFYHFLKARKALIQKDLEQALFDLDMALSFAKKLGYRTGIGWCRTVYAQVLPGLNKIDEAEQHIIKGLSIFSKSKGNQAVLALLLARAHLEFERNDKPSGIRYLREGLSIGKQYQLLNVFFDHPDLTAKLCAKALQENIEVDYVKSIVQRRGLTLDPPPLDVPDWPWPIKIFTLGKFVVIKHGQPIKFSGKAQKKPLAMLRVLIAAGSRNVTEEKIADILWPDADGDLAHRSFATTLHRLRKLIGTHDALSLSNNRLSLNPGYCWVDAQAFEFFLEQAEKESTKAQTNDKGMTLLKKALELYQGPFLDTEPDAWNIETRERLKSKYLRAAERFGSHLESTGQAEKAIDLYHRAVDIEPLAENIYCRLMLALKNCGQPSEAIAVYDRCRTILENTLDVTPSKEAESIYKSLVN